MARNMSATTCYICQVPTFSCDAGDHTHMDYCRNSSTSETSHGVCYACYSKLPSPKTCWCRTVLNQLPTTPPFSVINQACDECGMTMTYAGKRMTLKHPPEALAMEHGTFDSGFGTFLRVCFSCLAAKFLQENYDVIPEKYNQEEIIPWTETLSDFADILKGVDNANRHKDQLLMWIPNTSRFVGNTNLNKVLSEINHVDDLARLMSTMTALSDTVMYDSLCVRNYIKARLRKKVLELPYTDWREISEVTNSMSLVFSRRESSEIMLEWFLAAN